MKNNMKNKWLIGGAVAAFIAFSATVQATSITGSINFEGGTIDLNGPISTATTITAFGGFSIVNGNAGVAPTGSFAGTQGSAVTFAGAPLVFSPSSSYVDNPVLWTFTFGGNIYSFDLTSVVSSVGVGPSLNLAGSGILTISGGVYTPTAGTFSLSATGAGSGPLNETFGFTAGNSAVPDGGTTVMLLGVALSGLGLLRKKLAA
jgi:hypothetical protein